MISECGRAHKLSHKFIIRIQSSQLLLDDDAECLEYYFSNFQNKNFSCNNQRTLFDNTVKYSTTVFVITSGLATIVCANKKIPITLFGLCCSPLLYNLYLKRKFVKYIDNFNLLINHINILQKQNNVSLKFLQKVLSVTNYFDNDPHSSFLSRFIEYKLLFSNKLKLIICKLLQFIENLISKVTFVTYICNCSELRDCLYKVQGIPDLENIKNLVDLNLLVTSNFLLIIGLCLLPNTWKETVNAVEHIDYLLNTVIPEVKEIFEGNLSDIKNGYVHLTTSLNNTETDKALHTKTKDIQNNSLAPLYNSVQEAAINFQLSFSKAIHLLKEIEKFPEDATPEATLNIRNLLDDLEKQQKNVDFHLAFSSKWLNRHCCQKQKATEQAIPAPYEGGEAENEDCQALSRTVEAADTVLKDEEYTLFVSSKETDADSHRSEDIDYQQPLVSQQLEAKALLFELKNVLKQRRQPTIPKTMDPISVHDSDSEGESGSKKPKLDPAIIVIDSDDDDDDAAAGQAPDVSSSSSSVQQDLMRDLSRNARFQRSNANVEVRYTGRTEASAANSAISRFLERETRRANLNRLLKRRLESESESDLDSDKGEQRPPSVNQEDISTEELSVSEDDQGRRVTRRRPRKVKSVTRAADSCTPDDGSSEDDAAAAVASNADSVEGREQPRDDSDSADDADAESSQQAEDGIEEEQQVVDNGYEINGDFDGEADSSVSEEEAEQSSSADGEEEASAAGDDDDDGGGVEEEAQEERCMVNGDADYESSEVSSIDANVVEAENDDDVEESSVEGTVEEEVEEEESSTLHADAEEPEDDASTLNGDLDDISGNPSPAADGSEEEAVDDEDIEEADEFPAVFDDAVEQAQQLVAIFNSSEEAEMWAKLATAATGNEPDMGPRMVVTTVGNELHMRPVIVAATATDTEVDLKETQAADAYGSGISMLEELVVAAADSEIGMRQELVVAAAATGSEVDLRESQAADDAFGSGVAMFEELVAAAAAATGNEVDMREPQAADAFGSGVAMFEELVVASGSEVDMRDEPDYSARAQAVKTETATRHVVVGVVGAAAASSAEGFQVEQGPQMEPSGGAGEKAAGTPEHKPEDTEVHHAEDDTLNMLPALEQTAPNISNM